MTIDNIIKELLKLPLSVPDKSVYVRLKEMGCFEVLDKISVSDIRKMIEEDIHCNFMVNWWMGYSADKRCSSGWYFVENKDNGYVVGYINEEAISGLYEKEYNNSLDACASFIKHELDEIWKHAKKN